MAHAGSAAGAAGRGSGRGSRGGALVRNLWRIVGVIREPDLYLLVLRIYFPILFPITFFLVLIARFADEHLGWTHLLPFPINWVVGAMVFLLGASLWLYTYHVFVYGGDGSPSPSIRRTNRLVTWSIYARCRNPSVLAKLLGVLGLGIIVNSPVFTLVLVPLLLVGSLVEKVWRQEPVLVEVFGDEYLEYRKRVPLIVPRIFVPQEELKPPGAFDETPLAPRATTGAVQEGKRP